MTRLFVAAMAAAVLGCGSAAAQVGGTGITPGSSPLGMTSPLGIGPGAPVARTGIPLGATEMGSLGVSPLTSGTSPLGLTTSSIATCSGFGGSLPQASFGSPSATSGTTSGMSTSMTGTSAGTGMSAAGTASTSVFDGGGMAGSASGTCAAIGGSSLAGPAASASSPTGMASASSVARVGIPLGSTELGAGGLSPPSVALIPNSSAPTSTLGTTTPCLTAGTTSTTGTTSMTGMPTTSGSC
jgi:hypothetical protein